MRQELGERGEQLIRAQAARDRNALRIQQLTHAAAVAGGGGADGHGDRPGAAADGGDGNAAGSGGDKENDAPGTGSAGGEDGDGDLIQGYLGRIARLEKEVRRLRQARPHAQLF